MDIHRCRFVPYRPQSINSLAFSHQSNPKQKPPRDLRLAIGRENGDIEIWNPLAGAWAQERILRGSRDRTIEQLLWTQDLIVDDNDTSKPVEDGILRLFSSGGSSSITEWDLSTGRQKRHAEANVREIWCFAAQPQWTRPFKEADVSKIAGAPSQLLAAGCADGSIILFTTADDSLQYSRVLLASPAKKAKVISITWRGRNTVVAGYEDGTIRVLDVPSRTLIRTMSLGKPIEGSSAVVWTLKCLPGGAILSGDSSGELKIWDAKTLSLSQRLKAHDADILDIAISVNGDTIFTAGVDRRVVIYKQLSTQPGNKSQRWQSLMHRRYHQHDVKTLASFEAKGVSVIVSGGMDTVPIVMPLRNWETEYHRTLSHLPQNPQMSCSSMSRLMLTWWDRELLIWNLPKTADIESIDEFEPKQPNHQLLAKLELQGDANITSAQLSEDGRLIVAATMSGVRLFQIRRRAEAGDIEIRTRPIDLPAGIRSFGALSVGFSSDSKWLFAVRNSGLVAMIKILPGQSSKDKPQIHHQIIKLGRKQRTNDQRQSNSLGSYLQSVNCVAFSSDSRVLAAGDLSGAIDTWMLEGHEDLQDDKLNGVDNTSDAASDSDSDSDSDDESDSRVIHGQKWIRNPSGSDLPRLNSAILALSFKPHPTTPTQSTDFSLGLHATRNNPHPVSHELAPLDTKLIAVTASHQIIEFDVMSGKLSDWSRRNPSSCLPQSFTQIKDRVMGVFWDCDPAAKKERLWLYGPTWLFMLDLARDLSIADAQEKVGQIGDYDVREPLSSSAIAKRTAEASSPLSPRKKQKRNTGAGDEKKIGESISSRSAPSQGNAMEIDTGLLSPASDDEDEDLNMEDSGALTQLRRGKDQEASEADADSSNLRSKPQPQPPSHHIIFRYRSIFGIAALQSAASDVDNSRATNPDPNLEVILIERPLYDVDLVPRFDGGQDWST